MWGSDLSVTEIRRVQGKGTSMISLIEAVISNQHPFPDGYVVRACKYPINPLLADAREERKVISYLYSNLSQSCIQTVNPEKRIETWVQWPQAAVQLDKYAITWKQDFTDLSAIQWVMNILLTTCTEEIRAWAIAHNWILKPTLEDE